MSHTDRDSFNTFTLQHCAIFKSLIAFLEESNFVNNSGDMLYFDLNISYESVCKLRGCIVTDLYFSKNLEKLNEKSLYTKLSAFLWNPLMELLIVLLWFIQPKGQKPN